MPITITELLHPQFIVDTISEINTPNCEFSKWMGFGLGSGNIRKVPVRYAAYRINNSVREPANFRIPGTSAQSITPNPIGERRVSMARVYEKLTLDSEFLGNISKIDGPNAAIDAGGVSYVKAQMEYMAERINNVIQFAAAGAARGVFYLTPSGENWVPSFSTATGAIAVDLQVPSGNKSQLDMLGAGNIIDLSWENPAAPIVTHLIKVSAAMVQLTGMPLQEVVCNSVLWEKVINNTQVRSIGGTVQAPFDSYTYVDTKQDGHANRGMGKARLKALPWLTWNICDEVLSMGGSDPVYSTGTGTLTKVVADTAAILCPTPAADWVQMWHGGEYVAEDYGKQHALRMGYYAWKRFEIDPSQLVLYHLLNLVPVFYRPRAICYATVVF